MTRDFQIDGWRAHPQLHLLTGPGGTVSIEGRSMEVLVALAERAGQVVSREELLDRVWGELYVGEEVLSHAIWDLRRALGEDSKRPALIHTHRKRGYRLAAKVAWLEQGVGDTGRYRLQERIGGGAMGIVFRAEDTRLGRTVALKFLPPEWSRDEVAKARFLREAKTAAALDHPNICTLLEIDETDDGRLFLVMPFYRGETLKRVLTRGPLAPERAVEIACQVARGLAALHREGIVHRDIKPGNILLAEEGEARILDFGLAKFAGATRLTREDSSPGTPAYMAPEQVRGEEADPASDVWSLGVTLYEMLTGHPPFGSGNQEATFYAILHSDPAPLEEVQQGLARVVGKALAGPRDERYGDAGEMARDLLGLGGGAVASAVAPAGQSVEDRTLPSPRRWLRSPPLPAVASGKVERRRSPGQAGDAPGRPGRWRVRLLLVVALLAMMAGAAILWLPRIRTGRDSDPAAPRGGTATRVQVPPFENRTGDPALDWLGRAAADVVAAGLERTGRVAVLPRREVDGGAESGVWRFEKGAELGVAGAYERAAETLRIRADLMDLTQGRLVASLDPISAAPEHPEEAIRVLRDRLMSAVAIRIDFPYLEPSFFSHLPGYEAYREFWRGVSVGSPADVEIAREHLRAAIELEPEFAMASLYLAGSPTPLVGLAESEAILVDLEARQRSLTAYERGLTSAFVYALRGRWGDALLGLRQVERIAPRDPWVNDRIAFAALWQNRPREALEAMNRLPFEELGTGFARWRRVVNRGYALHMLGRYEEELDDARRSFQLLPNLPTEPRYAEVRALAALARLDELDRVIEASRSDVTTVWEDNTADFLLIGGRQLWAHGRREAGVEYAERAVRYFEQHGIPQDDARGYTWALWMVGRYDEAYEHHARLLASSPGRLALRAELGCLAALRGHREEALRWSAEIAEDPTPYPYGARHRARGVIAAHLGELDRAVGLLAEGHSEGASYWVYRVHYHLHHLPLLGFAPYEELVRPKG